MSNWAVAECAYCSCCVCLWRHNGSSLFPSTDLCPSVLCYSVQPIVLTPGEQLTWRDQAPQQRFGRARGGAVGVDWWNNWLVKGWNSSPFTQKCVFLLVRPVECLNFTVQNVVLVPKHNQNLTQCHNIKFQHNPCFFILAIGFELSWQDIISPIPKYPFWHPSLKIIDWKLPHYDLI